MLLAGIVLSLLVATLVILISVLGNSQTELVNRSNKHLEAVARSMADAYLNRADKTVSLSAPAPAPPPPLPGPPPGPHPASGPPPKPAPDDTLSVVAARVLRDETGIEGGFYRPADQRLLGYAFPTHEGPGDANALPARETPKIVDLAAQAVSENRMLQDKYAGAHDVVLFIAVPVCETRLCSGGPTGAAWMMQRIPGAETERKRVLLWSIFGFGGVACITVALAFLVLNQVDRGTQAVLDRLARMESDLSQEAHPASVNLAEFHRLFDGLDQLSETLRTQAERERELQNRLRQSERLAAIGQLAAGVAHELRNPLATIRLRSQMAQRRSNDEAVTQANSIIIAEVDRLDGIIERLLNFSRPIQIKLAPVDLSALCVSVLDRWSVRHPKIKFELDAAASGRLETDAQLLEQVLDNVIENAVHQLIESHIPHPIVKLDCRQAPGLATLSITDNGGGFRQDVLQRAIEPFFTTRPHGTGLGLAITHEIVSALGGSLTIQNSDGGATVSIQFPVVQA